MQFKVITSGDFYSVDDANKLESIGFNFSACETFPRLPRLKINSAVEIEIESLEALMVFAEKFGEIIVTSKRTIEIYDYYRE